MRQSATSNPFSIFEQNGYSTLSPDPQDSAHPYAETLKKYLDFIFAGVIGIVLHPLVRIINTPSELYSGYRTNTHREIQSIRDDWHRKFAHFQSIRLPMERTSPILGGGLSIALTTVVTLCKVILFGWNTLCSSIGILVDPLIKSTSKLAFSLPMGFYQGFVHGTAGFWKIECATTRANYPLLFKKKQNRDPETGTANISTLAT